MRRKPVVRRLMRVGDARAWIRTQRDFTLRRLAWRPMAPPPESFLPVFDHLDAEMAILERQLKAPEDAYARSMVKLTELQRDTVELAEYVQDKQTAARRVHAALEGFDPCGGVEIDSPVLETDIEIGRQAIVEARAEAARASTEADAARELADIAVIEFDDVFPWLERVRTGLMGWAASNEIGGPIVGRPYDSNAGRAGGVRC